MKIEQNMFQFTQDITSVDYSKIFILNNDYTDVSCKENTLYRYDNAPLLLALYNVSVQSLWNPDVLHVTGKADELLRDVTKYMFEQDNTPLYQLDLNCIYVDNNNTPLFRSRHTLSLGKVDMIVQPISSAYSSVPRWNIIYARISQKSKTCEKGVQTDYSITNSVILEYERIDAPSS